MKLDITKCSVSGAKRDGYELCPAVEDSNAGFSPSLRDGGYRRHGRVLSAIHNRILRLTNSVRQMNHRRNRKLLSAPFRLCRRESNSYDQRAMGGTLVKVTWFVNQFADFVLKFLIHHNILYVNESFSLFDRGQCAANSQHFMGVFLDALQISSQL